jgi:hypothetical protein
MGECLLHVIQACDYPRGPTKPRARVNVYRMESTDVRCGSSMMKYRVLTSRECCGVPGSYSKRTGTSEFLSDVRPIARHLQLLATVRQSQAAGSENTKNLESLLENAHTLTPAVVLRVDKDVVWEGIGVLSGDWWDVVFVLLDDVGNFHDGVAEGSFYSSPGCCCFCATACQM